MSDSRTILPDPEALNLVGVSASAEVIILSAKTASRKARCPVCRKPSGRVHSRYTRTLADLPWQGVSVTVRLRVRRFFCDEGDCDRAIFAERLPGVAAHYGRRTKRLDGDLRSLDAGLQLSFHADSFGHSFAFTSFGASLLDMKKRPRKGADLTWKSPSG
jgi:transposase